MGLREINATRTRRLIGDAAIALFLDQGYDATTMEEVAERAGVGASTVYRYFPNKELLIQGALGDPAELGDALRSRDAAEPIELGLGHAIVEFYEGRPDDHELGDRMRDLLESNSRLQARVIEWVFAMYDDLVAAIRERDDAGSPTESAARGWFAVFVLQHVDERIRDGDTRSPAEVAKTVMDDLAASPLPPAPRFAP